MSFSENFEQNNDNLGPSLVPMRKFRKLKISDSGEANSLQSTESKETSNQALNTENSENQDLSNFAFDKKDGSKRMTRRMSKKIKNTDQEDSHPKYVEPSSEEEEEKPKKKKVVKKNKEGKVEEEKETNKNMLPPKKGTRKSEPSDNDELKERKLEEISQYLFNYLKEPKSNTVNKTSLKRIFRGLMIDNISEEQADMMLNYPHLQAKNMNKEELTYDEFKSLVKECNIKFDSDGNIV